MKVQEVADKKECAHLAAKKEQKTRDYNTRGHQYKSRKEHNSPIDEVQINSTTMA